MWMSQVGLPEKIPYIIAVGHGEAHQRAQQALGYVALRRAVLEGTFRVEHVR